jgi:hypothetical protein
MDGKLDTIDTEVGVIDGIADLILADTAAMQPLTVTMDGKLDDTLVDTAALIVLGQDILWPVSQMSPVVNLIIPKLNSMDGKLNTIDSEVGALDTRQILIEKILRNKTETDPVTGIMTVYDDDNVTPLLTANLYDDIAGTTLYNGAGADRRNRLT